MKKVAILIYIFIVFFIIGVIWWVNGLSPVNSSDKKSVMFVVEKGAGLKEITAKLKTAGLIKNRVIFFLYTRFGKLENKIQAGDFFLNKSMTAEEIAKNLTHGTLDIWITIPEGKRAEEISEILQENISNYDPSWTKSLKPYEGYLFPDTYLIPRNTDINSIIAILKNNFDKKFQSIPLGNLKTSLTKQEIVTIASLVEREAKFPEDRPLVANVILNRFKIGMKLDIDATVQYALGYSNEEKNWWIKNLTFEDLKLNSPYNTYRNSGLPPTPIANPGIDALKAVINPADTKYLYYISDKSGHLHFARTLGEQEENINKFGVN